MARLSLDVEAELGLDTVSFFIRLWMTFVNARSKGSRISTSGVHWMNFLSQYNFSCLLLRTNYNLLTSGSGVGGRTSLGIASASIISASTSVSVSGVGVRCSNVSEEQVFDSDISVSVGCSDSVSGVGTLGLS